jgi:hypothetical protein
MRPAGIAVVAAMALALMGCGGGAQRAPSVEGPIVKGPKGVWIFRPAGKAKALVIFFHGQGGPTEATPFYHRPWIDHLVSQGDLVLYPRYELDYARAVLGHAEAGLRTALERVSVSGLPVVVIGYSRGGALAVEYAADARREHLPAPKLVAGIFAVPYGEQTRIVDLRPIGPRTRIVLLVGDSDPGGAAGVQGLLQRLQRGGFPGGRIGLRFVRSQGTFVADHLSFLKSTPAAQAAFWRPLDGLIAQAES